MASMNYRHIGRLLHRLYFCRSYSTHFSVSVFFNSQSNIILVSLCSFFFLKAAVCSYWNSTQCKQPTKCRYVESLAYISNIVSKNAQIGIQITTVVYLFCLFQLRKFKQQEPCEAANGCKHAQTHSLHMYILNNIINQYKT